MIQSFESEEYGLVQFSDKREQHHSAYCQPRDIIIEQGPDTAGLREEIAVEIRRNQGMAEVGIRKNLKWS